MPRQYYLYLQDDTWDGEPISRIGVSATGALPGTIIPLENAPAVRDWIRIGLRPWRIRQDAYRLPPDRAAELIGRLLYRKDLDQKGLEQAVKSQLRWQNVYEYFKLAAIVLVSVAALVGFLLWQAILVLFTVIGTLIVINLFKSMK